jgi:UDP-N-acetylmuramyl pentapeptide phosphotransferase/UDP-N-acetylglucosamine-1-phosphate transferase
VLLVVSLLIYLYFNAILNVLFMGDSGSLPLAFIIAFVSLLALKADSVTAIQVAVIHAVLITDSTLTLAVRCYRRERLSEAHRSHLYQRLIGEDRPHWPVSVGYAAVTMLCCILALTMTSLSLTLQGLCLLGVYGVLTVVFIHYRQLGR